MLALHRFSFRFPSRTQGQVARALGLLLLSACVGAFALGCVEEGHAPKCGAGGRSSWEEEDCMTPIGGSCLSEEEFSADRPKDTADEREQLEKDWARYQSDRPNCSFAAGGASN